MIPSEEIKERYDLISGRLEQIPGEKELPQTYQAYFDALAVWALSVGEVLAKAQDGELFDRSAAEARKVQEKLYAAVLPGRYETSFCNPAFAAAKLGEALGPILSAVGADLLSIIPAAFEGRREYVTVWLELLVEIYGIFTEAYRELQDNCRLEGDRQAPEAFPEDLQETVYGEIRNAYYWFYHDYLEVFVPDAVLGMLDADRDFFRKIVMEADLSEEDYLYRYGTYIGENERGIRAFLAKLPLEEIEKMARTFTEGYRMGFEVTGKDITAKRTVKVEYPIGFERVIREAVRLFEEMGLRPTISREAVTSLDGRGGGKRGCYGTAVNKQFDYDHKDDRAYYLDKSFVERRLEVLKHVYEKHKGLAAVYGGPAVVEVFGEVPFEPRNKPAAKTYTDRQNELNVSYASRAGEIINHYIPGDTYSFTIIAFPIPAIGEDFPEIFRRTVEINTLDYMMYRDMQQKIIDVLDQGETVHITGRGDNRTDIRVALHPLSQPDRQTNFENCVADVNIPVGEVFTSPVLKGTNGRLHVTQVYLKEFCYRDLEMEFVDGMVVSYTCSNFDADEENQKYIQDNVLYHHKTLPMGEFAIGTNTAAYRMARDFDIADKLPILIAEKTGPHFAVGDTCYSHSEDVPMYNPDGKEMIARENEVAALRHEDSAKAYFNCHTDITIPYDELGDIVVECRDGRKLPVISQGRFVVPGTERLNEAL